MRAARPTRASTAVAGVHPATSKEVPNVPEVPKVAADTRATETPPHAAPLRPRAPRSVGTANCPSPCETTPCSAQHGVVSHGDGQLAVPTDRGARGRRGAAWGGVSVALVSAATFGTSGTFGTSLLVAGWTPATAVLARVGLAALIVTVPAVLALRGRWGLLRQSAWTAVAYGLIGVAGCQVFYFYSISQMPVGVALLIEA